MKASTKDNLQIGAAAVLSAVVLFFLLVVLAQYRADWERLFGIAWWTAFVFGCAAYWYGKGLKRARCLLVFLLALTLHISVLVHYVPSGARFPGVFFLFFSPFEATAVGMLLMLVGGPPARRAHRVPADWTERKWPPRG